MCLGVPEGKLRRQQVARIAPRAGLANEHEDARPVARNHRRLSFATLAS